MKLTMKCISCNKRWNDSIKRCPRCGNNLVREPARTCEETVLLERVVRELAERWERRIQAHKKMGDRAERMKMPQAVDNNRCVQSAVGLCLKELRAEMKKLPNDQAERP